MVDYQGLRRPAELVSISELFMTTSTDERLSTVRFIGRIQGLPYESPINNAIYVSDPEEPGNSILVKMMHTEVVGGLLTPGSLIEIIGDIECAPLSQNSCVGITAWIIRSATDLNLMDYNQTRITIREFMESLKTGGDD